MMRTTSTSTKAGMIRVKWKGRVAGFDNDGLESLIQKACAYFHLGPAEKKHILMGEVDDIDIELSDDMLKHLPSNAVVRLLKAPVVVDSDSEEDDASTISGDSRSYSGYETPTAPQYPTNRYDYAPPATDAFYSPPSWSTPGITPYQGLSVPIIPPTTYMNIPKPPAYPLYPVKTESVDVVVEIGALKRLFFSLLVSDTVDVLKKKLQEIGGFSPDKQQLTYGDCQLKDSFALSDYGMQDRATIKLVMAEQVAKPTLRSPSL